MEAEQAHHFNERLSHWVAKQGFWLQVRYSMTGSSSRGILAFQLLHIGFRVLVFLLIVAAGAWMYLLLQFDSPKFSDGIRSSLQTGLGASESEMADVSRSDGQMSISSFACKGDNRTFFSSLDMRNIRFQSAVLDGLMADWQPSPVTISKLEIDLRAGADDEKSAHQMSEAIFRGFPHCPVKVIDVTDATLRWGYSEKTRGSIENCTLKVFRNDGKMKISIHGGTFSQNWFHKLNIVNIEAECNRDGIIFQKAEFRRENGTVDFSGLKLVAGGQPLASGVIKVHELSIDDMLPSSFKSFVSGTFSGEFKVSGSTNNSEGIGFDGLAVLDGQDTITLHDQIPILKALSVVDYLRSYRRVDFREGSFRLKTTNGEMTISDVDLKARDLLTLSGVMRVRLPAAKGAGNDQDTGGGLPTFDSKDTGSALNVPDNAEDFNLKNTALESKRLEDGKQGSAAVSLFKEVGNDEERRLSEVGDSERKLGTLRYEGRFIVNVLPDAFERTPKLAAQYPVNPETHRIPIDIPIDGALNELTEKQAEDFYQQGRR